MGCWKGGSSFGCDIVVSMERLDDSRSSISSSLIPGASSCACLRGRRWLVDADGDVDLEQAGNFVLYEVAEIYCGWPNASAVKLQLTSVSPKLQDAAQEWKWAKKGTHKS